jgi:uncharacterized protein (DUF2141 family)
LLKVAFVMQGLGDLAERWKLLASPARIGEWRRRRAALALLPALLLLRAPPLGAVETAPGTATGTACAPGAPAGLQIRVQVQGARNQQGSIAVTLYGSDPARFLASGGKLARLRVPVQAGGRAEACFAIAAPGLFAVAIYHDENNDHDFNLSVIGLPKEGYGFSNDAPTRFGVPSFADVRFAVEQAGRTVPVQLRY